MAAIIPEVLPTLVESGAGAVRGVLAAGESAISGAESVVESGSQIVTNIERVSNSGLGLLNKGVETINRFLETPIGGLVAGGTGFAFLKSELEHKNIDIKVNDVDYNDHSPFVTPLPIPVQQNKETIKQQYAPVMSKVHQIISSQFTAPKTPVVPVVAPTSTTVTPVTPPTSGPVTPSIINPPAAPSATFNRSMAMIHGF